MNKPAFVLCLLLLIAAGCSSQKPPARRFEVTGNVVAVDKRGQMLILKHRAIPGYMDAMTMGFVVKDDWVFNVAKPGDQVRATLVVEGSRSWLEGVVVTEKPKADPNPLAPAAVRTPEPGELVPEFTLLNQDGKKIHLGDFRGKALLLTFIYTRCPLPDYCPLMSKNFAAIAGEVQKDVTLRDSVRLLSISIDPEHDRPAVLRRYALEYAGERSGEALKGWQFATGNPEEVRKVAAFYGLNYWKDSGQIIHALVTALIDPQGNVHRIYRGNDWRTAEVLEVIKSLKPA
jgi:protein SCO1/2